MTEGKQAGRLAGLGWRSVAIAAAAAVTGTAALVVLADPAPPPARYTVAESLGQRVPAGDDPLRTELARCRALSADTDDARCRAAWEVNRRRFMGESRSLVVPPAVLSAPAPAAASPSAPAGER